MYKTMAPWGLHSRRLRGRIFPVLTVLGPTHLKRNMREFGMSRHEVNL